MAKGNVNPNPSPTPAPNPTPPPSAPPSTGTGGGGPTGNTGFSMNESSMQGLQGKAGDFQSRLSGISSGLRGLNFSGNALGPIGLFAVPALNASNDNAVSQADKGAKAFGDVQSGIKATATTATTTDGSNSSAIKQIDPSTNVKPPPGQGVSVANNNPAAGPNAKGPDQIKGGGGFTGGGTKGPGGPGFTPPPVIGGNTGANPGPKSSTTSGKGVGPTPTLPGATGGKPGAGPIGGGPVATPPPAGGTKGGTPSPSTGKGGGPIPGATPGIPGTPGSKPGVSPTGPGPQSAVTSPSTGAGPRGATPPPSAASPGMAPPMAPGATPNAGAQGGDRSSKFGGAGAKGVFDAPKPGTPDSTITKAPPGSASTPPPAPKSGVPGTPTPGSPKPGTTPGSPSTTPGPQSGVSPSTTGGQRGATPTPNPATSPAANAGVAPPMAPGATPGAQPPDKGGSKFAAPGTNKGAFDAPKPGTPDNTITKAPPGSATVPPPAPRSTPTTSAPPVSSPNPTPAPANPNSNPVPTAQTRPAPAPNVPPMNTPAVNTPSPDTKTNTPSPNPDTKTNAPSADTKTSPAPNQTRPAPGPIGGNPNPNRPSPNPNTAAPSTNVTPDVVVAPIATPSVNPGNNPNPNAQPNVVPRSHPAAGPFQAQTRPEGSKGRKRAKLKKWLGIDFIKGLLNKRDTNITPAPAPTVKPSADIKSSPWVDTLVDGKKGNVDVEVAKQEITAAVNDGKPAKARILLGRLKGTNPDAHAELKQYYDNAVAAKGDEGKVDVPKEMHFAWFGATPNQGSIDGMLEWAAKVKATDGQWKATLWTDRSSASWDPDVKQQLTDAGVEINESVPDLVSELSADVETRSATDTTINDVYAAANNLDAKAYNLASDIARYAVLKKHGGVYVDVDVRPGSVSLDKMGDVKMRPDEVPLIGPRLRDGKSVQNALGDPDAELNPDNVKAAADARWAEGELGNAFIVTPPNGDFITKFADLIPQKFDTLQGRVAPENFPAELKNQAPDVSGPNALVDSGLAPQIGLIGQFTMDPNGLDLSVKPSYMPHPVPVIGKTDFQALFDPDVKNQWNGLEWVTPESENQLDTDTKPANDNDSKPSNDKGGPSNTKPDADTQRRPAPTNISPAPPAPPAPDTKTDAPKTIKSGGAPPKMTPPTPESHQGKDVITDESWRHDPAKTADWFAPSNPASPDTWVDRREGANVRTVDVTVKDVTTDSTPSNIKSYDGLINYDLRRIETSPGKFVQEYTVKVHLDPGANPDPKVVEQVKQNATNGVNSMLNQGFRLPSGDQFHLNLEFTPNKGDAHTSIEIGDSRTSNDQTHWNPGASPEVLAHETLHYLGIPDEYKDSGRVFQQHDTNTGVHQNDGGMMGRDVLDPKTDPGLRPRHLWLIERTANSQVMVPDTKLDTPAPAPQPAPGTRADTKADTDPRQAPKRDRPVDSDSEVDDRPTNKPKHGGPSYTGPSYNAEAGRPGPTTPSPTPTPRWTSTIPLSTTPQRTRTPTARWTTWRPSSATCRCTASRRARTTRRSPASTTASSTCPRRTTTSTSSRAASRTTTRRRSWST